MSRLRNLAAVGGTLLVLPLAACATGTQWGRPNLQAAYGTGYERGERAGYDDSRRGDEFRFADESDYRDASRTRPRDNFEARYRDEFLRGYEAGYRTGYGYSSGNRGRGTYPNSGPPPWSNGRGRGLGRGGSQYDVAARYGYEDGYEAGVDDARDRRRFDPVAEIRYRNGDRGYERQYGTREDYRARYREAFRQGYEQGYRSVR
jgi:hypothetical protein